ncbi:ArdC family protein [Actinomadura nitritigenes]|uniref:ArdC family protein n=1 Tax=Actinomadura nitritigenes TaxID=134602 RepID=UPI003D8E2F46
MPKTAPEEKSGSSKPAKRMSPADLGALVEFAAAQMDPAAVAAFADAAQRLPDRYTLNNKFAIWAQCPDVTEVHGFWAWQDRGRRVRKGESGIGVFAALTEKADDDEDGAKPAKDGEDGKNAKSKERRLKGFTVSWVYDLSQTKPMKCPCPKGTCTCPLPAPSDEAGTAPDPQDVQALIDALTEDADEQ